MNESTILHSVPAAKELYKVPGFDPMKYLRRTVNDKGEPVMRMEPRYQRLWFRLACPKGRMVLNPLRLTDQLAIFEAKVFFRREDTAPASSFTSTKKAGETSNYIRAAQDEALMIALDNAGFGIQLCDLTQTASDGECRPSIQSTRADGGQEQPTQNHVQTEQPPVQRTPPAAGLEKNQAARQAKPETPPAEAVKAVVTEQPASEPAPTDQPAPESAQITEPPALVENIPDPAPQSAPAPDPAPADQPVSPMEVKTDSALAVGDAPAQAESQGVLENNPHEGTAQADSPQPNLTVIPKQTEEAASPHGDSAAETVGALEEPGTGGPAANADTASGQEETPQAPPSYTDDMSVEEICKVMTLEQAGAIVVPSGPNKGLTMGKIAEQRPSSLRFFITQFYKCSNSQKAAATLLVQNLDMKKAS